MSNDAGNAPAGTALPAAVAPTDNTGLAVASATGALTPVPSFAVVGAQDDQARRLDALRKQPYSMLVYAKPKTGKTVDSIRSNPLALFVARRDALLPAATTIGWVPPYIREFARIGDLRTFLAPYLKDRAKWLKDFPGSSTIVIDDLNYMLDAELLYARDVLKKESYPLQNFTIDALKALINDVMNLGLNLVLSTHVKTPNATTGIGRQHVPATPYYELSLSLTGMVGSVYTVREAPLRKPHKFEYAVNVPGYLTGDRLNVFSSVAPMNYAECRRVQKFVVPRAPELESFFQRVGVDVESLVDMCANKMTDAAGVGNNGDARVRVAQEFMGYLVQNGTPPWMAGWLAFDAVARSELRAARPQGILSSWF